MVRSELIEVLALKADVTNAKADDVVTTFFEEIVSALTTEGRVEIRGFRSFSVRRYRSYEGRNPKTGVVLTVLVKQLPYWKTGRELRERVDGLGVEPR